MCCMFFAQEKIVAGNQILITLSGESLTSSSLILNGGPVSQLDALSARTVSATSDHYGTGNVTFSSSFSTD